MTNVIVLTYEGPRGIALAPVIAEPAAVPEPLTAVPAQAQNVTEAARTPQAGPKETQPCDLPISS